jgi:hypothetical protein
VVLFPQFLSSHQVPSANRYTANGTGKMAAQTKKGLEASHAPPTATVTGGRVPNWPRPRKNRDMSFLEFFAYNTFLRNP